MITEEITNKFGIKQTLINISIGEMKSTTVDNANFFDCTVANWIESDVEFIPDHKSDSGSQYMFTDNGVYRMSNHWNCQVSTCVWLLNGDMSEKETIGYCSYDDFKKYSTKRDRAYISLQENISNMIHGSMVLKHRIGTVI